MEQEREEIQSNPTEDQIRAEINSVTQTFSEELTELIVRFKDTIPLSSMAKVMLAATVDLILNQGALQTQYVVQEMLAPLFKDKGDPSRIIIP
jgi:hypothetical protein